MGDAFSGWAAHAAQQHAGFASTAQLRLEFVRPLPELDDAVVVRATCDSATAEAGLARGEIVDENDELLAVCSVRTISLAAHRGAAGAAEAVASVGTTDLSTTRLADVLGLVTSRSADGEARLELRPGLAIANSADSPSSAVQAMLCVGADDEAARVARGMLNDPVQAGDIIDDMQAPDFALDANPSVLPSMAAKLRNRPDIAPLFQKVARDVPRTFVPLFSIRRSAIQSPGSTE